MIQRIQSVYLLIVTALLIAALFIPVGHFITPTGLTSIFKPIGVTMADGGFRSTWGLFGILLLSSIVSICSIFLFRNRNLQIRITIFNSVLITCYYVVFLVFMFALKDKETTYQLGWGLILPLISLVFNYMAVRAIYTDEMLVKASDRLRE